MHAGLEASALPFSRDADGVLRVTDSRVLVEMAVLAFQDGATPEAIVQRYPTLGLAEVYAVIAYYLRHRPELDAYLTARERQSAEIRGHIEARQKNGSDLRKRIAAANRPRIIVTGYVSVFFGPSP